APGREALADDLDRWLLASEEDGVLASLRERFLGEKERRPAINPASGFVLDLIARRLDLMPAVAAAKRAAGQPIADPARESQVLEAAARRARRAGLSTDGYVQLVRAEVDAAKLVQRASARAVPVRTGGQSSAAPASVLSLDRELRPAIDRLERAIVMALV